MTVCSAYQRRAILNAMNRMGRCVSLFLADPTDAGLLTLGWPRALAWLGLAGHGEYRSRRYSAIVEFIAAAGAAAVTILGIFAASGGNMIGTEAIANSAIAASNEVNLAR